MTVACKMINCPLNDNGFCCSESILITNNGQCFNLIRGFAQNDIEKLREESKINIEDVEFNDLENSSEEKEEEKDDSIRCDEGTRDNEQI